MNILLFMENTHRGGLDTFVLALINHWARAEDNLTLICNASHPGLATIEARRRRPCAIVSHRVPLHWEWMRRLRAAGCPKGLAGVLSPGVRLILFFYQIVALRHVLGARTADRLMIVNGGYPGGNSCRAAAIAWTMLLGRSPALLNVHNFAVATRWHDAWYEWLIDRLVARSCRAVVTVSAACARSMAVRSRLRPAQGCGFIYNGIDEAEPTPATPASIRRTHGVPDDSPLCLMLATFEPRKGHAFLLEAFARVLDSVPTAHLLICGDGTDDEQQAVRRLVDGFARPGHVHLAGFHADVSAVVAESDVLVVPSQAFESFGLTVVEAARQGIPAVTTDVGGLPEVVGDAGICVARDDVVAFANGLIRLLGHGEQRRQLGERARRRYREKFTAPRMAEDYARVLCDGAAPEEPAGMT